MKRIALCVTLLFVVAATGLFALEPYDSDVTVPIMRANLAAFGQLRNAASAGDFLTAAGALSVLAQGSFRLLDYEAPQGSQQEWQRIHSGLVRAALQGIQACSEKNADGLAEVVAQIGGFNRQGHGQFR